MFLLNPYQVISNLNTPFIPPSLTSIFNPSIKVLKKKALRILSYSKTTSKDYSFSIYSVKVAIFKLLVKRTRYKET